MGPTILTLPGQPSAAGLPEAQVAKARKAAQDFEAMALGQMLQPMFATVDTAHGLFGGGAGEETWKPMFVDAIGKSLAAHGGIGIARPVLAEMLRAQEARAAQPEKPQ